MNPKPSLTRALACGALALTAVTAACTPEDQALVANHLQRRSAALASVRSSSLSDEQLARLANCESGGNPQARSSSGTYHGLYQFNQSTWNGVARSVLPEYVGTAPSAAPREVQDAMARALYNARGRSPWPVCGRRL
ncbi:MAG TPA: transglycosylase family protein [Microthrixaceae bacterium]|nr:transglycosylase family protein [Microthrixaceae bacterium]HNI34592.1 transglycosylase family protein [Microthrixaceae bacterium]